MVECSWERVNNCMYEMTCKEKREEAYAQVLGSRLSWLYLPLSVPILHQVQLGHLTWSVLSVPGDFPSSSKAKIGKRTSKAISPSICCDLHQGPSAGE